MASRTLVVDSCTDTAETNLSAHTGESGTWSKHTSFTGDMTITDANRLKNGPTTGVTALYLSSVIPSTPDYDLSVDLVMLATNATPDIATCLLGVCGRFSASAITGYNIFYNFNGQAWNFNKLVAGSESTLFTYPHELSANTTYRMTVRIRDAVKQLLIDDVVVGQTTDNEITQIGRIGIDLRDDEPFLGNAVGPHLDNVLFLTPPTFILS